MTIERVRMPLRHDGRPVPNPYRWSCDYGHLHPSRLHAVKCHQRQRAKVGEARESVPYRLAEAKSFEPSLGTAPKGVLINILVNGIVSKSGMFTVRSLMPHDALVKWRKSELVTDVRDLIYRAERA